MRAGAALLFTVGAVGAAAPTYLLIGFLGAVPARVVYAMIGLGLLAYAVFWHATGRSTVPAGRQGFQARRAWVDEGRGGLLYFGAVLGVGFLTEMSTPLVHAGMALAAAHGPYQGMGYGAGFGAGRSLPTWTAVVLGGRFPPGLVGVTFVENYRRFRVLGALASIGGLVSLWTVVAGTFR